MEQKQKQLKDLTRLKQLEYTSNIVKLLQGIQSGKNTWKDIEDLRKIYNLPIYTIDTLRRGVVFRELTEADCLLDPMNYIVNPNTSITDPKTGESVETPNGTFKKEFKFNTKLGDYIQFSEAILPMTFDEACSPKDILRIHGYDPNEFRLLKSRVSLWQQNNKKDGVKQLYSTKIEVAPINKKENGLTEEDIKKIFNELVKDNNSNNIIDTKISINPSYSNYSEEGLSVVFSASDLHFGRYAGTFETGHYWDTSRAINQAQDDIRYLIDKIKDKEVKEIVYVINSDALNMEGNKMTSSGRHSPDNSETPMDVYQAVTQFYIQAINTLATVAPVKVYSIPGNHAYSLEVAMGLTLEAYFHNDSRISFNIDATPRKVYCFGDNMIVFAHGDKEGNRIKDIIPNEFSVDWGESLNHFLLASHVHHFTWEECTNGLEHITLNSPTLNDKWTNDKGYRSKNRCCAFVFSEFNLEEVIFINNFAYN